LLEPIFPIKKLVRNAPMVSDRPLFPSGNHFIRMQTSVGTVDRPFAIIR